MYLFHHCRSTFISMKRYERSRCELHADVGLSRPTIKFVKYVKYLLTITNDLKSYKKKFIWPN